VTPAVAREKEDQAMADERFLAQLWAVIESRKADTSASKSYTRQLLASPSKIRRKVTEEAYEVNEAHQALLDGKDTKDHLAHEAADLLYHLFVLLASADVTPAEVYAILERRHAMQATAGGASVGKTP
jgi:phosphoribosyl-ATP pyrophosphohydrolase